MSARAGNFAYSSRCSRRLRDLPDRAPWSIDLPAPEACGPANTSQPISDERAIISAKPLSMKRQPVWSSSSPPNVAVISWPQTPQSSTGLLRPNGRRTTTSMLELMTPDARADQHQPESCGCCTDRSVDKQQARGWHRAKQQTPSLPITLITWAALHCEPPPFKPGHRQTTSTRRPWVRHRHLPPDCSPSDRLRQTERWRRCQQLSI